MNRNSHTIRQLLPGLWLAAVLFIFLTVHPQGRPFYSYILPGTLALMVQGRFPWMAWLELIPRVLLLALGWVPWFVIGWLAMQVVDSRRTLSACLRDRVQALETLALAPGIGASVVSLPLVLLATFFHLSRLSVLVVLSVAGVVLYGLVKIRQRRDDIQDDDNELKSDSEPVPRWMVTAAWVLIGIITAWSFFHSLAYPVDYWDALIYYIHYGELTYRQGGFPVLVQLQVGLGLGANYPHLYAVLQASQAFLVGEWSDAYGQVMMPLAGLGTVLLIYTLIYRLYGRRDVAVFSALSFRLMTYAQTYSIWCSDYAFVMYGTAALLVTLRPLLTTTAHLGSLGRFVALPVIVAVAFPQLNYMGWIVWIPLVVGVALRFQLIKSSWIAVLGVFVAGVIWAAPWYIRNWFVTGNPVYAFFPNLFGGMKIDPAVLASCENEWTSNGDGLAQVGDTVWERFKGTPLYFYSFWWKWAPVVLGLAVPGFFMGWRHASWRVYGVAAVYALLVLFYGYAISGLYLYHLIALFPLAAIFGARVSASVNQRHGSALLAGVLLTAGVAPGVAFSIIGPKARGAGLQILEVAGAPQESFYNAVDPADAWMWRAVNRTLEPDAGLLTHENRYHVFRRDIRFIHLDDWDLLPVYDRPWPEVRAELERRNIRYYYEIPNERNHPITRRLGIHDHLDDFNLIKETWEGLDAVGNRVGLRRLYRLKD